MASFARAGETLSLRLFLSLLLVSSSVLSFQSEECGMESEWNKELLDGCEADITISPIKYWSQRRVLLQETHSSTGAGRNGRLLAVRDGRLDPFKGFRKYRGGYDVESKHYWGSVVFTGIFGYALAAAWLLLGLILGLSRCCKRHCCKGKSPRASSRSVDPLRVPSCTCWFPVFAVVVLTLGALGGCVALYTGNRNFSLEARNVERTLSRAADNATDTIGYITTAVTKVQNLLEPYESSGLEIENTKARLNNESKSIQHTVDGNMDIFDKIMTAMEAALIVVTTLNIIGIIMGPVCAVWKWRRVFYFIVAASWILTVFNSLVFGLYFMFNNAVEDTCAAMNEYMDQPYGTTLDAVLPCEDLLSARYTVVDIAKEIRNSLSSLNDILNSVQQLLGDSLTPLCGPPPEYQYISSCPNDTVTIGDLPKELEPLKCSSNDSVSCYQQDKFLTDSDYQKVMAYASSVQILFSIYPTVNGLTDCSIIIHAFSELLKDNCSPANSALHLLWISFLVVAVTMKFVILSWLLLYYPNKERKSWRIIAPQDLPVFTEQTK